MLKLQEELKKGPLSRYHLICGEERYMVRYYKNALRERLSAPEDEMNCTFFQGEGAEPSVIADVGQILPFMAEQRLIIVQDSGFFKKANDMADYLADFPDSTYVVFVEREVDKRSRLYKWISKNGCITECQTQTEPMLKQWIAGYVKRQGKVMSNAAVEHLMERVGTDMERGTGHCSCMMISLPTGNSLCRSCIYFPAISTSCCRSGSFLLWE